MIVKMLMLYSSEGGRKDKTYYFIIIKLLLTYDFIIIKYKLINFLV